MSYTVPNWQNSPSTATPLSAANLNELSTAITDLDVRGLSPVAVQSSAYTAAAGQFVPVNTVTSSVTITLPTAPSDKAAVGVKHVIQGGANTVTIAAGGSDVFNKAGGSTTFVLTLVNQGAWLEYNAANGIWYVMSDDLPLGGLDGRYVQQSLVTTKGDIIAATGAAAPVRLSVGSNAQVLSVDPTQTSGIKWAQSNLLFPTAVQTSNYSANPNDYVLVSTTSGNVTVTFPTAPADKTVIGVKQIVQSGVNAVTLQLGGSDVFDVAGGANSGKLVLLNQAVIFQYIASSAVWVTTAADVPLSQLSNQFVSGLPLSSGEATIYRSFATATTVALSASTLRLTYFRAQKSESSTQVRTTSGGTAASGATLCRIGVYSLDASGNGTLVASTANDTTLWGSTGTVYTKSWSSSFTRTAGQIYALAVLFVGTTAPQLTGIALASSLSNEFAIAPRLTGSISSQSDLPSTFTAGSVTTSTAVVYGAILP